MSTFLHFYIVSRCAMPYYTILYYTIPDYRKGLHYAAQGLHYAAQGLPYAAQGRWLAAGWLAGHRDPATRPLEGKSGGPGLPAGWLHCAAQGL